MLHLYICSGSSNTKKNQNNSAYEWSSNED